MINLSFRGEKETTTVVQFHNSYDYNSKHTRVVKKVHPKLILKAAEEGNIDFLTKVADESWKGAERDLDWMTHVDKKGRAVIHIACMKGHIYIVRLIWRIISDYTRDVRTKAEFLDVIDFKGRTPLFHASAGGHVSICNYLLDRQADPDICTNENHESPGSTALMACAEKNRTDCFKLLMRKGADVILKRKDGADAIYMAARYGNHEIINIIATSKMYQLLVNRKSFHGRTALVTAALHGHLEACKALHVSGFDLDSQDNDNFTALIYAANAGHYRLVRWLVKSGADIYLKDRYEATALDIARANDFEEMSRFLEGWQNNVEHRRNTNHSMKSSINRAFAKANPLLLRK